jgi:transcriptional regulator with XRE-family HTH domain
MIHPYSPEHLRSLRQRALMSQREVERSTGISDSTIHYLEHGLRKPQTRTLDRLLMLYATRISRLERVEKVWEDPGDQINKIEQPKPIKPSEIPRDLWRRRRW